MSENDNQPPLATVFCRNGCGFYGSSQSDGLCSVCFKETMKQNQPASQLPPLAGAGGSDRVAIIRSSASSSSLLVAASPENTSKEMTPSSSALRLAPPMVEDSNSINSSDASAAESQSADGPQQRRRNRCDSCRKKVGLTGFECRCGGTYCPAHRYSDKHDCQFDYQGHGQDEIRRANPQVVKSKVDKL